MCHLLRWYRRCVVDFTRGARLARGHLIHKIGNLRLPRGRMLLRLHRLLVLIDVLVLWRRDRCGHRGNGCRCSCGSRSRSRCRCWAIRDLLSFPLRLLWCIGVLGLWLGPWLLALSHGTIGKHDMPARIAFGLLVDDPRLRCRCGW